MAEEDEAAEGSEAGDPSGLDLARSLLRGAMGASPAGDRPRRRDGARRTTTRRLRKAEAQLSGAHPDGRDPQMIAAEVGRMINDRGWGLDLKVRGVFARWTELVGPEIGDHSTPESLTDGVLVLRAHSTAWATQLKLLSASLVRRLNEELGDGTVTVVEVLAPDAPSWKHGLRSARGRGPRDTYG